MNEELLRRILAEAGGAVAGQNAPLQRSAFLQNLMGLLFGPPGVKNATINLPAIGPPNPLVPKPPGPTVDPTAVETLLRELGGLTRSPKTVPAAPGEALTRPWPGIYKGPLAQGTTQPKSYLDPTTISLPSSTP